MRRHGFTARARYLTLGMMLAWVGHATAADIHYRFITVAGNKLFYREAGDSHKPTLYPQWQAYLRKAQPTTLVVWGDGDPIFTARGAYAIKEFVSGAQIHHYNTGHFALGGRTPRHRPTHY